MLPAGLSERAPAVFWSAAPPGTETPLVKHGSCGCGPLWINSFPSPQDAYRMPYCLGFIRPSVTLLWGLLPSPPSCQILRSCSTQTLLFWIHSTSYLGQPSGTGLGPVPASSHAAPHPSGASNQAKRGQVGHTDSKYMGRAKIIKMIPKEPCFSKQGFMG